VGITVVPDPAQLAVGCLGTCSRVYLLGVGWFRHGLLAQGLAVRLNRLGEVEIG